MIDFEQGEYVILTLRRHWFFILINAIADIVLSFLPLILFFIVRSIDSKLALDLHSWVQTVPTSLIIFFYALWILFFWSKFYIFWTDYYLDAWYITSTRVIDIEQKGFFRREISSVRYKRIEDITIEVTGFIATMLDFGRINVQTAGEVQEFTIYDIPRPYAVKEFLGEMIEKTTHKHIGGAGNDRERN